MPKPERQIVKIQTSATDAALIYSEDHSIFYMEEPIPDAIKDITGHEDSGTTKGFWWARLVDGILQIDEQAEWQEW